MNISSTTLLSIGVSLLALLGVTLHDTKIDKLTTVMVVPAAAATLDVGSKLIQNDPHTHVHRIGVADLKTQMPRIAPRVIEQKKHFLQRGMPKGTQNFDTCPLFV